ncbi:class I SAM-dependent methyltransferase [Thermosyntropha sp.]|uniref:tRNA (adenine(22)-N(1))-methyltransferase n=1 Tax=Thermosyntropha sp. TaxID=2740820 RepID=UPI0025EA4608|nr:class I SAM-dependent methyltransferase [Thermosyntropha sp.]MBO8159135.1 SAM-dependent methyltransferase [Thermosyntropha sp.]
MHDKRLQAISGMIIKGRSLADIGTDHAYLPIYLVKNNIVPFAIATDINNFPYERAESEVKKHGLEDKIEVRLGDGLKVISPGEVDNVVIAGMGGETITGILEDDLKKASSFKRFIFQPMSRPEVLRRALAEKGWIVLEEKVVYENKKFFIVISAEPGGTPYFLSDLEAEVGPLILRSKSYPDFLRYYLQKYRKIVNELSNSTGYEEKRLKKCYEEKIKELEGFLYG